MSHILTVRDLVKTYPAFTLDHVSFSLEEGKITGFIGRNGAGKTTTIHSLLGLLSPDSGEIRFWGDELRAKELELLFPKKTPYDHGCNAKLLPPLG